MKSQELKQARQHRGWTQEAAASHLGVTQSYLNLLENGKRRLTSGWFAGPFLSMDCRRRFFPSKRILCQPGQTMTN